MIPTNRGVGYLVPVENALSCHKRAAPLDRPTRHPLEEDFSVAVVIWMIVAYKQESNLLHAEPRVNGPYNGPGAGV